LKVDPLPPFVVEQEAPLQFRTKLFPTAKALPLLIATTLLRVSVMPPVGTAEHEDPLHIKTAPF
jgi:hypothetical protein